MSSNSFSSRAPSWDFLHDHKALLQQPLLTLTQPAVWWRTSIKAKQHSKWLQQHPRNNRSHPYHTPRSSRWVSSSYEKATTTWTTTSLPSIVNQTLALPRFNMSSKAMIMESRTLTWPRFNMFLRAMIMVNQILNSARFNVFLRAMIIYVSNLVFYAQASRAVILGKKHFKRWTIHLLEVGLTSAWGT